MAYLELKIALVLLIWNFELNTRETEHVWGCGQVDAPAKGLLFEACKDLSWGWRCPGLF
jgi:hypothetical protein